MGYFADKPFCVLCSGCKHFKLERGSSWPYKCNSSVSSMQQAANSDNSGPRTVTKSSCKYYETPSASGSSSSPSPSAPSSGGYSGPAGPIPWYKFGLALVVGLVSGLALTLIVLILPSGIPQWIAAGVYLFFGASYLKKTRRMRFWTSVGYIAFFGLIGFFVIGPFVEGKINDIRRGIKPKNKSAVSAPAVPGARKATVSAEAANFRDAPSTDSNIIKSLKKGTVLTVTGAAAGGWLPVEYEGVKGYVSADLVTNTDNR